jgi:hypothetical protein
VQESSELSETIARKQSLLEQTNSESGPSPCPSSSPPSSSGKESGEQQEREHLEVASTVENIIEAVERIMEKMEIIQNIDC